MLFLTRAQQVILAAAVVAIMIGTVAIVYGTTGRPRALPVEQLYEEPAGTQTAAPPTVAERQPVAPSQRPTPQPAYVPRPSAHGSSSRPLPASERQPPPTPAPAETPSYHLVNVNTAGATELQRLPGVGPKTAEKIILHREQNGPFRAPQDLLAVTGIGAKKLQDIYPHICF
jgi:competence protein ComEA